MIGPNVCTRSPRGARSRRDAQWRQTRGINDDEQGVSSDDDGEGEDEAVEDNCDNDQFQ